MRNCKRSETTERACLQNYIVSVLMNGLETKETFTQSQVSLKMVKFFIALALNLYEAVKKTVRSKNVHFVNLTPGR